MLKRIFSRVKLDCDVLFLCSAAVDEIWIRTTLLACLENKVRVHLAVCGGDEPSLTEIIHYYRDQPVKLHMSVSLSDAASIKCNTVVTASSGLSRDIFPTQAKYFVHMPHSLASLHMIYPEGAFSGYDVLLACGPHHVKEFNEIIKRDELKNRIVEPVGYGKLDILKASYEHAEKLEKKYKEKKHILLAPSWGIDNLLERFGIGLLEQLVNDGNRITVRPHPLFIIENAPIIDDIVEFCRRVNDCHFESPLDGDAAIFSADLLVGDYSGASFEFFSLRRRTVLSVDVGRKIVNENWESYGLEPIELSLRHEIGYVSQPSIDEIIGGVRRMLNISLSNKDQQSVCSKFLFPQYEHCGRRAFDVLRRLNG